MNNKNGFTLVELAIALMVIGLLIGGVLKGQELIENARIITVVRSFQTYHFAVSQFYETYDDLPGLIANPERIPNCNAAPCNDAGDLTFGLAASTEKTRRNFWIHLQRAGYISGVNESGDHTNAAPEDAYGTHPSVLATGYILTPSVPIIRNYYFLHTGHPMNSIVYNPVRTQKIDTKLDDGKPHTGSMQLLTQYWGYNTAGCSNSTINEYLNNKNLKECVPIILIEHEF